MQALRLTGAYNLIPDDIAAVSALTALTELDVSSALDEPGSVRRRRVAALAAALLPLRRLRVLGASSYEDVSRTDAAALGAGLAHCDLRDLRLERMPLGAPIAESLCALLPQLTRLQLPSCELGDAGVLAVVHAVAAAAPALMAHLDLRCNQCSPAGVDAARRELRHLPSLRRVALLESERHPVS